MKKKFTPRRLIIKLFLRSCVLSFGFTLPIKLKSHIIHKPHKEKEHIQLVNSVFQTIPVNLKKTTRREPINKSNANTSWQKKASADRARSHSRKKRRTKLKKKTHSLGKGDNLRIEDRGRREKKMTHECVADRKVI